MIEPEVGPLARSTSARLIVSLTGRPVFLREQHRQRLEIDRGLAAEAAADLGRHDLDIALGHPEHAALSERTSKVPWVEQ